MSRGISEIRRLKHVTAATSKDVHDALGRFLDETPRHEPPPPEFYKVFVTLTSQVNHRRLGGSVRRHVRSLLLSLSPEIQRSVLDGLVKEEHSLITLGYVVESMVKSKTLGGVLGGRDGETEFKKQVLAKYIRETILSKEVQAEWVLKQISENLLAHVVSRDGFRDVLLPACQKAMLRSPETSIQRVGSTLLGLEFDLSEFSGELGKLFGTSLHSNDERTREHALIASTILSKKMIQSSSLKSLLEWYLGILNGSEGKLALAAQKIIILRSIGEMSDSDGDPKGMSEVALWLFDTLIKALDSEVHEGTLVEYLDVLCSWSKALGENSSSRFMTFLPKGLGNLKGTVRATFCRLLATYFRLPRNKFLAPQLEVIQKSFEKLTSQLFQGSNLLESICLGLVLLLSPTPLPDSTLQSLRNLPQHIDRKLVDGDPDGYAEIIATFSRSLIRENYDKTRHSAFDALAIAATVKSYEIREKVKIVIGSVLYQPKVLSVAIGLIRAFERHLPGVHESVRVEILRFLCRAYKERLEGDELEVVALELLPLSICSRPHYWLTLLQLMGLRPDRVMHKHWKTHLSKYLDGGGGGEEGLILETLSFLHGEVVVESLVKGFKSSVKELDFKKVTRDEYFIYHTPEGQLYDHSVLETGEFDVMRNLKRESKAYSYKEQLEEINLRKELEKKRKEAGKEPKWTQRQKEVMKGQLEKEDAIRRNIRAMDERLQSGFLLLNAALKGNVGALGFCVKDFLGEVIELMGSSLSAPYAVNFYLQLGDALFQFNKHTGSIVCHVSLKVFSPKCDLSREWDSLPLGACLLPMLNKLLQVVQEEEDFAASNYAFVFPFFKETIMSSKTRTPEVILVILNCTMGMLKGRVKGLDQSPEFIPRAQLTQLLYYLIGTTEHRLQQTVVNVLLELAKSSGDPLGPDPDSEELAIHLHALTSHLPVARDAALRSLSVGFPDLERLSSEDGEKIRASVFQACYDPEPEIEPIAQQLWATRGFQRDFELSKPLLMGVVDSCLEVRVSGARALGELMEGYPDEIESVVERLMKGYDDYLLMTPPILDDFGRILQDGVDTWEGRHGAGLGIRELARSMPTQIAKKSMRWLLGTTFLDRHPTVHVVVLDAALQIVQLHGKKCMEEFATLIESHLDQSGDSSSLDRVRQSCVVLMGCLARHIDPKDPRVKSIFTTLLDTLSTPSEKVQEAVANCLPALVPAVEAESGNIVKGLLKKIMEGELYGERRGGAYGLAGMIKGSGVLSLKQHDIMNILAEGMQDKKNFKRREGSLMALELLCEFLGRLFEPYIVHVLPYLLQCLGDGNQYVREATEHTARAVMSRLSGHGVKLVLPALLTALNEDSWRTKCGSVDLLGRMAYCAPKQLSGCLPMIVPRLIEVLGDSHVKVQDSGAKALSVIGSVIRNPEIQSVVPTLLQALQDPAKKTNPCLQILLRTEFVHVVDSPSLALIMPVVERAFQDRSTENRRMACQIIGNMYSLTDHSDLAPYMKNVMPGIRASLLDPVPEVRSVAAKALGSMTRGMGEKCYEDLLPWLMKTLVSESNSVDRSGAAQGLAEVIGALGVEKLRRFMPEVIRKADSDDIPPHVRDGYMMMFIYMPSVFENDFVPYIGEIINPILKALADENEFVRETALRAGQRIVTGFADTAILLLLPQLRQGIFDDNWRIRYSSVQLLGDLLYKISGVSGKMSTESAGDDDNFGTENSQTLIIQKLGQERRNQILAGLYMGRSDVALMVRQSALHVWKVIVANTPKTLREILPTLFSLILSFLGSGSHDKRQVAGRTLGDLVRKLGEKILPEIIPILERGLESPSPEERQGVCIGLSEIMGATSREMVLAFVENLVPTLRRALCDPILGVRMAAAQTFASLHSTVGSRALDEILPFMLRKLSDETEGSYALDGLGQILQTKSKAVMPYLIPQLIAPPPNTKALGILAAVAGEALSRQLPKIFPVLIQSLKEASGTPRFPDELNNSQNVLLSVEDEVGVRLVIEELLDSTKTVAKGNRKPGILLLSHFLAETKAELKPHIGTLIRALILLMTDTDEGVIGPTADAITSLIKHVPRDAQMDHIEDIRQAIRFARSDLKNKTELPGLTSPKAVKALLGIFRETILYGPPEMKEQAANGMSELIVLANPDAIRPSVINVTGPLIRILGDRYSPDVKVALIDALSILLPKVGPHLRAFGPQLLTTFQKAVNDENKNVRTRAEYAMTQLIHVPVVKH